MWSMYAIPQLKWQHFFRDSNELSPQKNVSLVTPQTDYYSSKAIAVCLEDTTVGEGK